MSKESTPKVRKSTARRSTIETLETRQVMSADPLGGLMSQPVEHHNFLDEPDLVHHAGPEVVHHADQMPELIHHGGNDADFWIESSSNYTLRDSEGDLEQTLNSAHGQTGLNSVRTNYGFTGIGQTVAVIDSGIAYDHYALGGGYGAGYRVVGGWDFAENDADFYDDGAEGSHGTHVAGIVGGTGDNNGNDVGVAPGVDIVGLRVFDDAGNGSFGWVRDSLQWVLDNRTAFENPITAVNLSLGTTWNSGDPPAWASYLEDMFQQLEQAGVFIAVSAGNSYTSYNTPGLSYPAASDYVVPVMSVDDSGNLSYFSQRHSSAIAAPGRYIRSTIPDYAGNNNGQTDDWANFSGTSMASPYVAGASVLIRQAMELVGQTNITQDTIYDHMIATADSFYDSSTDAYYNRLNLANAIDELLPDDDYGSTAGQAHSLGTLSGESQFSGMISMLDDADFFTFTAGVTGTATFSGNASHELATGWDFNGASASQNGNGDWEMNVVAGQTYTIALTTNDGLGYYDVDVNIESTFSFVDWSNISGQQNQTGIANSGEQYYRVVAGQTGYVTAEAFFAAGQGNVDIEILDANQTLLASASQVTGGERIDYLATAGEELFLKVSGTNSDIDFRLTNQVAISGSTLTIDGTAADDTMSFTAGANYDIVVNGVDYSFASGAVDSVTVNAGSGDDAITITGSSASETARMYLAKTTLSGGGFSLTANAFDDVVLHSGGGTNDVVYLYDTNGNEQFTAWSDRATFTGAGFSREVFDFDTVTAYSTNGDDTATFYDTTGNDTYVAFSDRALLYGTGYFNDARGFGTTVAHASTGFDKAIFNDGTGDEVYTASSFHSTRTGDGFSNEAIGFNYSIAYTGQGNDLAIMNDSAGDDIFTMLDSGRSIMYSNGSYYNDIRGFSNITANSTGGNDRAVFRGDAGDDTYDVWDDHAAFSTAGVDVSTTGYDYRVAFANGGSDEVSFYDSVGDDTYVGFYNRAVMYGSGWFSDAYGFATTRAYSTSGDDNAIFHDSAGDDTYTAYSNLVRLTGAGYSNEAHGFGNTIAHSSTGNDTAYYFDSAGYDIYVGWSNRSVMYGDGYYNDTRGFDQVEATATVGEDRAVLQASAGDEEVHAESWGAYITDGAYRNEVRGFAIVNAFDQDGDGGADEAFTEATDYIFNLYGDWS